MQDGLNTQVVYVRTFSQMADAYLRVFDVPYPGALTEAEQAELRTNPQLTYILYRLLYASPTLAQVQVRGNKPVTGALNNAASPAACTCATVEADCRKWPRSLRRST